MQARGASLGIAPNGIRALEAISQELRDRALAVDTLLPQLRVYSAQGQLLKSRDEETSFSPFARYGPMPIVAWWEGVSLALLGSDACLPPLVWAAAGGLPLLTGLDGFFLPRNGALMLDQTSSAAAGMT